MIEYFFSQYEEYETPYIALELIAVFFGIISVIFAKKNSILVFPTGLISTIIYFYLLYKWSLLGDMLINGYYAVMSIYGWYIWTRKKGDNLEYPITKTNKKDIEKAFVIFILTILLVILVYHFYDKFTNWTAYVDTFTTGLFFVGMWLMAKRKIENWLLWIIGDAISIPLYFYKGLTFSSFQFIVFTIIAIFGYLEWRKILQKET